MFTSSSLYTRRLQNTSSFTTPECASINVKGEHDRTVFCIIQNCTIGHIMKEIELKVISELMKDSRRSDRNIARAIQSKLPALI